ARAAAERADDRRLDALDVLRPHLAAAGRGGLVGDAVEDDALQRDAGVGPLRREGIGVPGHLLLWARHPHQHGPGRAEQPGSPPYARSTGGWKFSNSPLMLEKKSDISASAEMPVACSSRRRRKPAVRFIARRADHPAEKYGRTNHLTIRRSRKSPIRRGASRKSSACRVGGVSTTTRS